VKLSRSVDLRLSPVVKVVASIGFLVVAILYTAFCVIVSLITWLAGEWSISQERKQTGAVPLSSTLSESTGGRVTSRSTQAEVARSLS